MYDMKRRESWKETVGQSARKKQEQEDKSLAASVLPTCDFCCGSNYMWPRAEGVISVSDLEDSHCSTYSWKRTCLLPTLCMGFESRLRSSWSETIRIALLCGRGRIWQQGQSSKLSRQLSLVLCSIFASAGSVILNSILGLPQFPKVCLKEELQAQWKTITSKTHTWTVDRKGQTRQILQ